MKLISKIKNLFTEEVEEVEPIKKEIIKVEIPAPAREEKKEESTKIDDDFSSPIFFDDKDFEDLELKIPRRSTYKKEEEKKVYKQKEEEKKEFKPSPIISPVYGVLNKNYIKEDIKPKTNYNVEIKHKTIDEIRQKAYGSLEDELENTLSGNRSFILSETTEKKEEQEDVIDLFKELEKPTKSENNESLLTHNFEVSDEYNENLVENFITEESYDEIDNEESDELFDLIDSMYDKEDDDANY